MVKIVYAEFEKRVGQTASPRGAKTTLVESAINASRREFTVSDLERACPGVSRDMIRWVLRSLQETGKVEGCLGRGPGAPWKKKR